MAQDAPLLAIYERGSKPKWKNIMTVSESKAQKTPRASRVETEEEQL